MFFDKKGKESELKVRVLDIPKETVSEPIKETPLTFEQWKDDLEWRLFQFEVKNPQPDLSNISPTQLFIQVEESIVTKGLWLVYKNGVVQKQFSGILAQRDATVYANNLINGLKHS